MSVSTSPIVELEVTGVSAVAPPVSRATNAPKRFYRPELDVLRFFAFMGVFLHHGIYNFSPVLSITGGFGLCFFFFLSAFLITELLQREKSSTTSIAIPQFYIRRTLRIWPLYYGFLLLSIGIGSLIPIFKAPTGFYLSYAFMVGNFYVGRYGFPAVPAVLLWSISVEEQFYLFWPLLNRYCTRRKIIAIALFAFPIGTLAIVVLAAKGASPHTGMWSNSAVQFQMFACGALISLLLRGRVTALSTVTRTALVASGVLLWLAAARWSGIHNDAARAAIGPAIGYYVVGLGCVLLFLGVYGIGSRLIPAPLVFLGKISYGLYVFHWLMLDIASWIFNHFPGTASRDHHVVYGIGHLSLGLLLSILVASLSYRYFETPFLNLKDRFSIIHSRAV